MNYGDELLDIGPATPPPPCSDVLFIAAAGSGEHYTSDTNLSISPSLKRAYDGFHAVLAGKKTDTVQVLDYPALPVSVIGEGGLNLPNVSAIFERNIPRYLDGKEAGVSGLYSALARARLTCPDQAVVLAGYSQGAMVVHQFLQEYALTSGPDKFAIKGAILLADPGRVKNSQVFDFGTAMTDSYGICQYFSSIVQCKPHTPLADIPAIFRSVTTSVCFFNDPVCDTSTYLRVANLIWAVSPGGYAALKTTGERIHGRYATASETTLAGKRTARFILRG